MGRHGGEFKMVACTECGAKLRKMDAIVSRKLARGHRVILCGDCGRRDEEPPQVQLVYSNWAPWNEQPVIPVGDLLCKELKGRFLGKKGFARPA